MCNTKMIYSFCTTMYLYHVIDTKDYRFMLKPFANYILYLSTTLVKVSYCKNNV